MSDLGNLKKGSKAEEDLNITPLIDIIFILLIFFVVTTTFVKELEIDIERPGAASATKINIKSIRIAVTSSGDVFVNGKNVNQWMVQSTVAPLVAKDSSKPVLIVADKKVRTGTLIDIVDQCRLAGAENVGVDVERK